MTLDQLFRPTFQDRHAEPALLWENRTYTFGEIDRLAHALAANLAQRGLRQGDRLCVYLPNSLTFVGLFLACTRLGVIFVPINILYRDREISHILEDAAPKALIAPTLSENPAAGAVTLWLLDEFLAVPASAGENTPLEPPPYPTLDGDSPAAIIYTSGTTGRAKGAVLTHNSFATNGVNLTVAWRFTSADRLLLALPLFHVHGLANGLHCWLLSGCLLQLEERFVHQQAADWFARFRPTVFFAVPTMYIRMLEWPAETARQLGQGLRLFVSGSAPLPAQVLEDFARNFGHRILERYGMSETLMNLSNPYAGERRAGTVGQPLPGVSAKILNDAGQPVAEGETGELYIKGGNLFAGYWRRPEATEQALHDGWFRTGDLASRSADGYYTLHGRRGDLIISGGFNIYPREIEEFLCEQPGIDEAAVTGQPDPRRGEVPVAYYAGNLSPEQVEALCRQHLASFKLPRAFHRLEKLPRTALGKIQKHLLAPPSAN